jgi:nicotinamide riboside kinase
MTALPFTKGHEDIIRFATAMADTTVVIFSPAAGEPHINIRWSAIRAFCATVGVLPYMHINQHSEDPNSEGFWDYWRSVYIDDYDFKPGDYIVGGDSYVLRLADELGGTPIYLPRGNETSKLSGTFIRSSPVSMFGGMSKHMQDRYRKKITIFGAESVGKTTLVNGLGMLKAGGTVFPEFARPYLEQNGSELSTGKFVDIICGQVGQHKLWESHPDIPVTFWDTDLLSTIGYLRLHPEFDPGGHLEKVISDFLKQHDYLADKYFILSQVSVPFEQNELRYGGDVRESDDQFWMHLCDEFGVDWEYISTGDQQERYRIVLDYAYKELNELEAYKRPFNKKESNERNGLVVPGAAAPQGD